MLILLGGLIIALAAFFLSLALLAQQAHCDRPFSLSDAQAGPPSDVARICYCKQNISESVLLGQPCLGSANRVIYGWARKLILAGIVLICHWIFLWAGRLGQLWMRFGRADAGLVWGAVLASGFSLSTCLYAPILISAEIRGFRP